MVILPALAAFILAVVLHGMVMRVPMQMDSVRRFLLVGVPLGLVLVAYVWFWVGAGLHGLAVILFYALLCELYLFCFTLVLSSVSATMLIMLRNGPVAKRALIAVYDPDQMVQLRLDRLLQNGFLEGGKGRLAVTAQGMKYHKAFTAFRIFFGHGQQ
jgi:hypothetical protein